MSDGSITLALEALPMKAYRVLFVLTASGSVVHSFLSESEALAAHDDLAKGAADVEALTIHTVVQRRDTAGAWVDVFADRVAGLEG